MCTRRKKKVILFNKRITRRTNVVLRHWVSHEKPAVNVPRHPPDTAYFYEHQNNKSKGTKYKLKELLFSESSLKPTQAKEEFVVHYSNCINLHHMYNPKLQKKVRNNGSKCSHKVSENSSSESLFLSSLYLLLPLSLQIGSQTKFTIDRPESSVHILCRSTVC